MISAWKSGLALVVAIGSIAGSFQGNAMADDSSHKGAVAHSRITQAQAEAAALAKVPGGTVKRSKLQEDNHRLVWSIDIVTPFTKKVAAVQVDAYTGKVLSKLAQRPADRAEESSGGKKNQ